MRYTLVLLALLCTSFISACTDKQNSMPPTDNNDPSITVSKNEDEESPDNDPSITVDEEQKVNQLEEQYFNDAYSYTFSIPSTWRDKIIIDESRDDKIDFYHKCEDECCNNRQKLLSIRVIDIDKYDKLVEEDETGIFLITTAYKNESYAYLLQKPFDMAHTDKFFIDEYDDIMMGFDDLKGYLHVN